MLGEFVLLQHAPRVQPRAHVRVQHDQRVVQQLGADLVLFGVY